MKASVQKLLLGNGLAQAIQFLSILLLSRIYGPEEFGILGQVQSIAMIFSIAVTLQLHLTIPLQKTNENAINALNSVQSLSIISSLIFISFGYYYGQVYFFGAFLAFFLGLVNTYNGYSIFSGNFGLLSKFYIARSILIVATQLLFALLSIPYGLIWAAILAEALSAGYLRLTQMGSISRSTFDWKGGILLAKEWRAFSLYGTFQEAISVLAFYAPLFLFSQKYGEYIGGQYAMANRLVWGPAVLLSGSISQVLYHKFSKSSPNNIGELIIFPLNILFIIAVIIIITISFFLKDFYIIVLGNDWVLTADIIPIQIILGAVFLFSISFRVCIRIFSMQKFQLIIDTITTLLILSSFLIDDVSPIYTMWLLVIIAFLQSLLISISVMWRIVRIKKFRMIT